MLCIALPIAMDKHWGTHNLIVVYVDTNESPKTLWFFNQVIIKLLFVVVWPFNFALHSCYRSVVSLQSGRF